MRLIDADKLIEIAHEMIQEDPDAFNGGYSYDGVTVEEIANAPTIEAVPVVHGEWIEFDIDYGGIPTVGYQCSECGQSNGFITDFCPNCGAKKEG